MQRPTPGRDRLRQFVANTPPHVDAQSALYRTRAALDPTYSTREALSGLVSAVLGHTGALSPALTLMSRENRAHVAAAALAGWARYHEVPLPPALSFGGLVEHRVVRRHTFTVAGPTDAPGGASQEMSA